MTPSGTHDEPVAPSDSVEGLKTATVDAPRQQVRRALRICDPPRSSTPEMGDRDKAPWPCKHCRKSMHSLKNLDAHEPKCASKSDGFVATRLSAFFGLRASGGGAATATASPAVARSSAGAAPADSAAEAVSAGDASGVSATAAPVAADARDAPLSSIGAAVDADAAPVAAAPAASASMAAADDSDDDDVTEAPLPRRVVNAALPVRVRGELPVCGGGGAAPLVAREHRRHCAAHALLGHARWRRDDVQRVHGHPVREHAHRSQGRHRGTRAP